MSDSQNINTSNQDELYRLLDHSKGIQYAEAEEETLNTDLITGKFQMILDYSNSNSINHYEILSYQNEKKSAFFQNILQKALMDKKPIDLTNWKREGLNVTERTMAMLLTLFMVFSSIHTSVIIRDRQNGMETRYQFACKSRNGYILGYMLYSFIITYLQLLMCTLTLMMIQKDFSLSLTEGLVLTIIIAVISVIFAMLICQISRSEVQANIMTSALSAVMSLLGGVFVAVEAMPALLRIISIVSPIRWVIELIRILP
jgi:ABC-2 type transport system permease protein